MSATNGILPPHPVDWLQEDPSLSVVPPLINNASSRSPQMLDEVVDQFDVESAARYRPRDVTGDGKKETWCNLYVSDLTAALCAPVPHWLGGKWQTVVDNVKWLRAGYNGWRPTSSVEAQKAADAGYPAVAAWEPIGDTHGHIALLVPSHGHGGVWLTQAGARCYRRAPVLACFGSREPLLWFRHE